MECILFCYSVYCSVTESVEVKHPAKEKPCQSGDYGWCSTTFTALLQDTSTQDVAFKTSNGDLVGAHKAILAAGSPVFSAMLYGDMKESGQDEIDLTNMDTATLKSLILFIYTGHIHVSVEECCNLLQAARYFGVDALVNLCIKSISGALNLDNFSDVAEFAVESKFDVLRKQCVKFLEDKARKVMFTHEFNSLPLAVMLEFTKSNKLKISEINMFLAVVEWSKHQEIKLSKSDIKSVFKQIRYPLICKSELQSKVLPTKLADPVLYKAALKHRNGGKYTGRQEQIRLRDYRFHFNSSSFYCDLQVVATARGTMITMNESCSYEKSTQLHICPKQGRPILFVIFITKCSDKTKMRFGLRYFESSARASMDTSDIPIGKEVDGSFSVYDHKRILAKIGDKTMSIPIKRRDALEFTVSLQNKNDQILIQKK